MKDDEFLDTVANFLNNGILIIKHIIQKGKEKKSLISENASAKNETDKLLYSK